MDGCDEAGTQQKRQLNQSGGHRAVCHSERSEESLFLRPAKQKRCFAESALNAERKGFFAEFTLSMERKGILRFAQNDRRMGSE